MVRNFLLIFLLTFSLSKAYGLEVQAFVSSEVVGVGQNFNLHIQVTSEESVDVESIDLPSNISPFELKNSWESTSFSQRYSYPGGRVQETKKNFYYQLSSDQEGEWTIGAVTVQIDSKIYKTKPIKVTVSNRVQKKPPPQPPSSIFPPSSLFDIFEDPTPFFGQDPSGSLSKDSLMVRPKIKDTSIYLGEMVPVFFNLYQKQGALRSLIIKEIKPFQPADFWVEKLDEIQQLKFTDIEVMGGQNYLKSPLNSYVLFPLKTGKLKIPPLSITIQSRDLSYFFQNSGQEISIQSRPIILQVNPLPKKSRGNFTGAVGSFLIESKVDQKSLSQDEVLSYKVRFEGQGNIHTIKLPPWPEKSAFKVYDILESQKFSFEKSWKEYEILLSPKSSGNLKTPSFQWTTFDPSLESYISHELKPIQIRVRASKNSKENSQKFFNTQDLPKKNQDPKKKPPSIKDIEIEDFKNSFSFYKKYRWIIWFMIYATLFLIIGLKYRSQLFPKRKNWDLIIRQNFLEIKKQKELQNFKQVGVIILNLIQQILSEVCESSGRELKDILATSPPSFRKNFEKSIYDLMQKLENLSFAPRESIKNHDDLEAHVEKVILESHQLIQKMMKDVTKSKTKSSIDL